MKVCTFAGIEFHVFCSVHIGFLDDFLFFLFHSYELCSI